MLDALTAIGTALALGFEFLWKGGAALTASVFALGVCWCALEKWSQIYRDWERRDVIEREPGECGMCFHAIADAKSLCRKCEIAVASVRWKLAEERHEEERS